MQSKQRDAFLLSMCPLPLLLFFFKKMEKMLQNTRFWRLKPSQPQGIDIFKILLQYFNLQLHAIFIKFMSKIRSPKGLSQFRRQHDTIIVLQFLICQLQTKRKGRRQGSMHFIFLILPCKNKFISMKKHAFSAWNLCKFTIEGKVAVTGVANDRMP